MLEFVRMTSLALTVLVSASAAAQSTVGEVVDAGGKKLNKMNSSSLLPAPM